MAQPAGAEPSIRTIVRTDAVLFSSSRHKGSLTTLYSFDLFPAVQVLWGSGETLYGATFGPYFQQYYGQVFIISPQGKATFIGPGNSTAGVWFQGTDSFVYGTGTPTCDQYCTVQGGWVSKISADGTGSVLYNFCPAESDCTYYSPGPMIQALDGNFYGTVYGGSDSSFVRKLRELRGDLSTHTGRRLHSDL